MCRGELLSQQEAPTRSRHPFAAKQIIIYGVPFSDPAFVAEIANDPGVNSHDAAMRHLLDTVRTSRAGDLRPAVLLAHAFVAGGEESESERSLTVGGSSAVSPGAFEDFAYVALGHLHKPQAAGAPHIRYSGSLLAYSKSEVSHAKGVELIEVMADGSVHRETIKLTPARPLRAIEGCLEELIAAARCESDELRDAYVIATLTDAGPTFDAHGKLLLLYPNLLHLGRAVGHSPNALPTAARETAGVPMRSTFATFEDFFADATGGPLDELERRLLSDAVREAAKTAP